MKLLNVARVEIRFLLGTTHVRPPESLVAKLNYYYILTLSRTILTLFGLTGIPPDLILPNVDLNILLK